MTLDSLIDKQSVLASLKAPNKKQLLQELSQALATQVAIDHRVIFETLLKREKLGSTGIGQGIAIPHGKLPSTPASMGCSPGSPSRSISTASDGQPVDLVFVLLAPEDAGADHLKALAKISRLLRDPAMVAKLRGTDDAQGLYAILTEPAANPRPPPPRRDDRCPSRQGGRPAGSNDRNWAPPSVHAHRHQFMLEGAAEGRFPGAGDRHRRAIGIVQAEQLEVGATRGLSAQQPLGLVDLDLADVAQIAFAQQRQVLRREINGFLHFFHVITLQSECGGPPAGVRAVRGDSSRRPLSSRAPVTSMPSASTKARWNWRAAMPRCR